ncbi:MAG: type II toxin-antitoxin system VapC family toxin [Deinococcota bacterium]|jgi:ribonuclease VapC|nr:type II toxin-antitoxin system VapC family toxin [Deinococcota bacterium]
MVVDTSVILHVFFEEPGWETSVAYLLRQEVRLLSAASLVEVQAVIAGRTSVDAFEILDRLLLELKVEIVPLSTEQANIARMAYLRYGKGRGHRAQLNYGDVMTYALAKDRSKDRGEVLAFVGDDFNHTDLEAVRLPISSR